MADILLITDQDRWENLVRQAVDGSTDRLAVARSLDAGLKSAIATPPAVIFIQSRLSGLSGELLINHVKNLFNGKPPKIVLVVGEGGQGNDGGASGQAVLLSPEDADTLQQLRQAVAGPASPRKPARKGKRPGVTEPIPASPDAPEPAHHPLPPHDPRPVRVIPSEHLQRYEAEFAHNPAGFAEALASCRHEPEAARDDLAPSLHGERPVTVVRIEEEPTRPALPLRDPHTSDQRMFRRITLAAIGLATLVACALFLAKGPRMDPSPSKANRQVPVAAAKHPPTGLPSFIAPRNEEPEYGITHPGWERYLASDLEFKIFREATRVKALQVIDRTGKGIPAPLFTKVLREMTGKPDFTVETQEQKDGFRIEKGSATPAARVIAYRRLPDETLKGLVIHFQ